MKINRFLTALLCVLVADDDVRDYGKSEKHEELTKKWQEMGYNVISMRDDWKTIYGKNVRKTGSFHWLQTYADKDMPANDGDLRDKYPNEQKAVPARHNLRLRLPGAR